MRGTAVTVQDGRVLLDPGVLKGLRKTQGFSQETLADACLDRRLCVSVASIKRAETGKPVLYRTARHLASMFGVAIDALIDKPGAAADQREESAEAAAAAAPSEPNVGASSAASSLEEAIRYGVVLQFAPRAELAILKISALIRQFGAEPQHDAQMAACFGRSHAYGSDSRRALLCALALLEAGYVDVRRPVVLALQDWGEPIRPLPPREWFGLRTQEPMVHVAQPLIEQLSAWFEFAPATTDSPQYCACLRVREAGETATLRGLAGRSIEVLQFGAVLDAVQECQDGHVIYVRGMAGIGKSRLVDTFRSMAHKEGFTCHGGEFHDFGVDDGSLLLTELVFSLAGVSKGIDRAHAGRSAMAAQAFERLKLPSESRLFLLALLESAPKDEALQAHYAAMSDRERHDGLQTAMSHLMLKQAIAQPLMISIEDVHWGDTQTLGLLSRLMAATSDAPIVWLLTSRHEGDPLDAALRPNFAAALSVLDLAPLRPREAVSLAAQFIEVDPAYRAACIERAQGNPLYLTQLLANHESEFPDSLRHLVQTRVDRLPPSARNALRYAAVLGHRFELTSLQRVLGDLAYVPEQEIRQMMIRKVEGGAYAFVHDLVMRCVYESIPATARQRMHHAVAALYRDADLSLYAQHLARSGDAGACRALLAAMRDKLASYHYAQALELGNLCDGLATLASERLQLALLQGQADAGLGQMNEAAERFGAALDLAASPAARIEAALLLAPVLNALDRLADEERLIEETLPLAHNIGAHADLARLLQLRGNIHFPQGDYALCRQLQRDALRYARRARHAESEARALSGIADSYYAQGRMKRAYAIYDQCVARCELDDVAHVVAGNLAARGSTAAYLGLGEQALRDSEHAVACSARIGDRRAEVFARLTAVWALNDMGQDEQAREAVEHALALAQRIGTSRFEPMLLEVSARLALRRGEASLAWRLIVQAEALVDRLQLQRYVGAWVLGSMALIASEPELRDQALAKGEAQLMQQCLAHNALRFYLAAAELALIARQPASARQSAQRLRALAGREPYPWIDHHAQLIEHGALWVETAAADAFSALQTVRRTGIAYGFAATMPRWSATLPAVASR